MSKKCNIAIFASGGGSNAEQILQHFENKEVADVACIVSNQPNAGVLDRAIKYGVRAIVHNELDLQEGRLLEMMKKLQVDFIVLAGYLKKIPEDLIQAYPNRIVNIHPALLPKFGGKGMFGMNVHRAVVEAGERESGPTIHFVNENYDEGAIIAQFRVDITEKDTPEQVAAKVLKLEHQHYAPTIEQLIQKL